jgi:hypothetical protein
MADKVTVREASLDGYLLEIEDIEDTLEKAIAVYEIPFRDGALLEDMGQNARKIRFKCFFYEDHYDVHRNFLNHLASKSLYELIHPKYGLIKGKIDTLGVKHNDLLRSAEIDVSFIEQWRGKLEPGRSPDVKSETEAAFEKGITEHKQEFIDFSQAQIGAEGRSICGRALDAGKSALSQLTGISRQAQAYVKQVDTFVAGLESELTAISNPANSLIAAIDFGTELPGRVIGAIAQTAERYSILFSSLITMPEKFLQNTRDAMYDLGNKIGFDNFLHHGSALQGCLDLGGIFSVDESQRDLARRLEQTPSFDTLGNYIKADVTPVLLDVRQVEKSLAIANALIQDSVNRSRSMQSLKDMARILTEHAIMIKIECEKLKTIYVDEETPLHLLCLMHGLPYNYAERLWTINSIINPNSVKGAMQIYVG